MPGLATRFIQGDWDTDWWAEQAQQWSPGIAGAIFGAAWWYWADAIVYEKTVEHLSPPFKYSWPGIIATLSLVFINAVSRSELRELSESGEEGSNLRARLWLLFSFLLALGAVGGSVSVLIACTQANQFVTVGVGAVVQSGLILVAALLLWAFRSVDNDLGYGYI